MQTLPLTLRTSSFDGPSRLDSLPAHALAGFHAIASRLNRARAERLAAEWERVFAALRSFDRSDLKRPEHLSARHARVAVLLDRATATGDLHARSVRALVPFV